MEVSYEGFEEQLKAVLVAIEASRTSAIKSTMKRDRELKQLQSSINYDNKE